MLLRWVHNITPSGPLIKVRIKVMYSCEGCHALCYPCYSSKLVEEGIHSNVSVVLSVCVDVSELNRDQTV